MNKLFIYAALLSSAACLCSTTINDDQIKWLTWDEAIALHKDNPKKIFVGVYTKWCLFCKRMDKSTFQDPEVVKYMNQNFYAVKMDAEMKEDIVFKNQHFRYIPSGTSGVHMLAYYLLEGQMSYPSFVTLDERFERIAVSPGYKKKDQLLKELKYAVEQNDRDQRWSRVDKD